MKQLVVLVGLPGSGKTSFRMRYPQWAAVSADDIRRTVFHCDFDPVYEDAVERIFATVLVEAVESAAPVVCVDKTNLTRPERQSLIEVARLSSREPIAHVMPLLSLDMLYERKQEALSVLGREHPEVKVNGLPFDVYERMYRRYEEVREDEGFARVLRETSLPLPPARRPRTARREVEPTKGLDPLPLFVS